MKRVSRVSVSGTLTAAFAGFLIIAASPLPEAVQLAVSRELAGS